MTHKKWRRHFCVKFLHFSGKTVRILFRIEEKPECTHQLFEKIHHFDHRDFQSIFVCLLLLRSETTELFFPELRLSNWYGKENCLSTLLVKIMHT